MPTLILQQNGIRSGGQLNGPLYIGRRSANSLVIPDPAVSRLHAWIGMSDNQYFIADADSRTGTFVNHERISDRRPLNDGDRIDIGPAEMVFHSADALPPAVQLIQFVPSPRADGGVFFECQCGEMLWAGSKLSGRTALCASCGAKLKIPGVRIIAESETRAVEAATNCGICHALIESGEKTARCAECGSTFHQSCWAENHGCSTYGCGQVNSLEEPMPQPTGASDAALENEPESAGQPFPWDFLLLGAAAVSIPIGALLFGGPGLIIAVAAASRIKRADRRGVVWLALALSLLAVVLGVVASLFWWFPKEL